MRNIVRTTGLAALVAALAIGTAACGEDDVAPAGSTAGTTATVTTTSTTTTDTATSTTAKGEESTAQVTLGKPEEMAITVPSTVKAGTVKFEVTNSGASVHEFVILKTDTKAADLSTEAGKATETGLVDRTELLDPGASEELQVDLTAGHYVVLCNVPGHYQAGMYKDLTVQ